jgi:sorbitol/mannitol transport system permease protein
MARKVTSRRVLVSTIAAWLFGFLIFPPILWMVLTSFKTELDAFSMPPKFLLFHWTTENYATVQQRSDYFHHALNSVIIAGGSTLVAMVIAIPAPWSMAFRADQAHQGRSALDALDQDDATGRRAGPDLSDLPEFRPLGFAGRADPDPVPRQSADRDLDDLQLFQGDSKDILEAARMDGATIERELVYVLTPIAIPGLASTMLLNLILAWNEAFWTLNLSTSAAAPLTVFIASYSSPEGLFWAKLSAASTLAIAPIVILGWFSQRQLVRGLTFGAVK